MDQQGEFAAADFRPAFEYDGTAGGLYRIFWPNLLFTVLTLGFYRFWGITNFRRYAWSHMRFQRERLVYAGTGGELFKGAMLAGLLLLLLGLIFVAANYVIDPRGTASNGAKGAVFSLLGFAAVFAAQRYRLSRTLWRGIRGGMSGEAMKYGIFGLGQSILVVFTLGIYLPVATVRLARRRINPASFGNLPFVCTAQATGLWRSFWIAAAFVLVLPLVLYGLANIAVQTFLATADVPSIVAGASAEDIRWFRIEIGMAGLLPPLLGFVVGLWLGAAFYNAASRRTIEGATTIGPLQFRNIVTGPDLIGLYLGNALILLFTLGLGYPYVLHRRLRLTARTVQVSGELDGAALEQNREASPARGEGLLSQLDPTGAF